jgi:TolB-like protein
MNKLRFRDKKGVFTMKNKKIMVFFAVLLLATSLSLWAQQLTVAVSSFDARGGLSKDEADSVTELFIAELVKNRTLKVVDRNNFDKILAEMRFQDSDWADSNRVAQLGRALNANGIIRGTVMSLGGQIVIAATVLDINTAEILSSSTLQMRRIDEIFDKLPPFTAEIVKNLPGASGGNRPAQAAGGTYKIGDIGPAGGIVFYDKGSFSNGWRYLEAAPAETEFTAQWEGFGTDVTGTATVIGSGKRNTEIIKERLGNSSAAGRCSSLYFDGFTDWFLPSKDELDMMFLNLKARGLGGFGNDYYWSSSQYSNKETWNQSFSSGHQYNGSYKSFPTSVRAVRAF